MALAGLVTGAVISASAAIAWPRRFSARAELLPQSAATNSSVAAIASQLGITIPGAEPSIAADLFTSILESREVLTDIARANYTNPRMTGMATGLAPLLKTTESQWPLEVDKTIAKLRKQIVVDEDKRTNIVTITVTTHWPTLSYEVLERLMRIAVRRNVAMRSASARAERIFLEGRVRDTKRDLDSAEAATTDFLVRNRSYRESPPLSNVFAGLERLVTQRATLYSSLVQAYEQARLEEVRNTPNVLTIDAPIVPARPDGLSTRGRLLAGASIGLLIACLGLWIAAGRDAERR